MSQEPTSSENQSDSELIEEVLKQANASDNPDQAVESSNEDDLNNAGQEVEVDVASSPNSEDELVNDALAEIQTQLKQAQNKADDNWEKVVRIQAEMDNLKRRTQKDLENAHKYALEKFAKELLVVIDSLELGIQAANSDNPEVVALKQGSELTIKQFESVFAKFNISAIDPDGETFNPELHQAMSMQESADVAPNTVLTVFQKGYVLNGRLIRPAMVVVSKAPAKTNDKPDDDAINLDEQA